ncbi:MAG: Holliday junction resolvase RuvX, partial [Planctomycetes bacterium]|nr:Holliday junction resolvase RuvX [Planctomycetota bacterium]
FEDGSQWDDTIPQNVRLIAGAGEFDIDEWVVGLPLNMDGSAGPQAKLVERFAQQLAKVTGAPVRLWDERLSSYEADQRMAIESAWNAYLCYRQLLKDHKRFLTSAIDSLRSIKREFPGSEEAKKADYHLAKLAANPKEMIRSLSVIKPNDPSYLMARFELCGLYHQKWAKARSDPDTAPAAAKAVRDAVDTYLRAAKSDANDQRKLRALLLAADVALHSQPAEATTARGYLTRAKPFADALPQSSTLLEGYHFRLFEVAKSAGDNLSIQRHANWLLDNAAGSSYERAAIISLAIASDQAVKSATDDERRKRLEAAARVYLRLVQLQGDSKEVLTNSKNARVAVSKLAAYESQLGHHAQATKRLESLLEIAPKDTEYLRRAARSRRTSSQSPYPPPTRTYPLRVQLALLKMNLRSEHEDSVKRLIGEKTLATDLDSWALLVEHGESEHARKLMRSGWQDVDRNCDHLYTAAFETNLMACLTEITEPDLRYYGELLLSALVDAPAEDPPGRTREQRLVELAERFAEVSFPNESVKQRALLVLGGSDGALALVADVVAEEARGIDLGAVCSLRMASERQVKSGLVLLYSKAALAQGDPNVFRRGIDSVVAARDRVSMGRGNEHERTLEQMAKHLCQFVETIGPNLTAAQLKTLSGLASRLAATASDNSSSQERARFWGYCEVYYAMPG